MDGGTSDKRKTRRVPAEALRWSFPADALAFATTDALAPVEGTVGQSRALQALAVGLESWSPGYNVFVSGETGTRRLETVRELLANLAPKCPVPREWAYVHNFRDPARPRLVTLRPGQAVEFRQSMREFAGYVQDRLPGALEDREVERRREEIVGRYADRERAELEEFKIRLHHRQLALVQVPSGAASTPAIFPVYKREAIPLEKYKALAESGEVSGDVFEAVKEDIAQFDRELHEFIRDRRAVSRRVSREIQNLGVEVAQSAIEWHREEIRETFDHDEAVERFLDEVTKDILDRTREFSARAGGRGQTGEIELPTHLYEVNVIADRSGDRGAPVVVNRNPTFTSLFGTIESSSATLGSGRSDHRQIAGGTLLQAEGGFLILYGRELLGVKGLWPALLRTLASGSLQIMATGPGAQRMALKPEAIPIALKVIVLGEPGMYDHLQSKDPGFKRIFKVRADFASDMELRAENLDLFARSVARFCEQEQLRPVSREAIGRLAEEAVRAAGRRKRMSARIEETADIVREADYWSSKDGDSLLRREHVSKAIRQRSYRFGERRGRMKEQLKEDLLIIRTEGAAVGQINGLSVVDTGYSSFGKPTLITASTAVGRAGIISIEREAQLSGEIYDKGVLIISGYLRRLFAQRRPLALTASLCFEQSYSGVDGDSASIAEIFALLSALSGIPIDQGIAVTGSINQAGEIQPVGGTNEKIECFFELCESRGLTGGQGVIIPERNVPDLMLDEKVVAAVRDGQFHVWGVSSVEDGVEVLTRIPAGERDEDGQFPEGTMFGAVEHRLEQYLEALNETGWAAEDLSPRPGFHASPVPPDPWPEGGG